MAGKKMTILDFQKYKDEGRKFSYVTGYDYTTASIINDSDVECILVGDSLGMIMLGYASTVPVTLDDVIHHARAVVKGAPDKFWLCNSHEIRLSGFSVSQMSGETTTNGMRL